MRSRDVLRLTAFLSRIVLGSKLRPPLPGGRERLGLDLGSRGSTMDLYVPAKPARRTVVAVHGVTLKGGRDARLVHFARSLTELGIACAVPTLAGLSRCCLEREDVDDLVRCIELDPVHAQGRVVVVGFCYGASLAVLASAAPSASEKVAQVIAFGAYHSLRELFEWYAERYAGEPRDEHEWGDKIFIELVLAHQRLDSIPELKEQGDSLESLLYRYCDDASPREKRAFFDQHLSSVDLSALVDESLESSLLDDLSPRGPALSKLACPVTMIHDPEDQIVPAFQAEQLHADLLRQAPGLGHSLLVTSLISHVDPASPRRLGDVARLYRALGPLIES